MEKAKKPRPKTDRVYVIEEVVSFREGLCNAERLSTGRYDDKISAISVTYATLIAASVCPEKSLYQDNHAEQRKHCDVLREIIAEDQWWRYPRNP